MNKKNLIIYYSWSGNTKKIAEMIQKHTNGYLFEINPTEEYSLNYSECLNRARREINAGETLDLKALPENLENYDKIFIGSPNWLNTMAPPILSFLRKCDLSDKTIIPFLTHGGGGEGHFHHDIVNECKNSEVLSGISFRGDGGASADSEIKRFILGIE